MNLDIDYATVESSVANMKEIAKNIEECKKTLAYYANGSVDIEGEFAESFGELKLVIQETVGDISSFIDGYAKLIDNVALNYEILDNQMKKHIESRYAVLA